MDIHIIDQLLYNVLHDNKTIVQVLKLFRESPLGNLYSSISEERLKSRLDEMKNQLKIVHELNKHPFVKQRSPEWYKIRNSLITASDFGQAMNKGKFGNQNDFFRKKVGYEPDTFDGSSPPLQWGIRYEEVANKFYKKRMNVTVFEYGIMKHPKYDFIGASPDGVSDTGVMLEIKCPYNRKNSQQIHEQYKLQIQGQLEVCDLEYCDYLECYIKEYDTLEQAIDDKGNPEIHHQGIVLVLNNGDFAYGELDDLEFSHNIQFRDQYIYAIYDFYIQRVKRDRILWNKVLKELKEVWVQVLEFRQDKLAYDKKMLKRPKSLNQIRSTKAFSCTSLFRDIESDKLTPN
jgi:putative phage-type endonuclease